MEYKFDKEAFLAERTKYLSTQLSHIKQIQELQRLLGEARDTILRQHEEIEELKDSVQYYYDCSIDALDSADW